MIEEVDSQLSIQLGSEEEPKVINEKLELDGDTNYTYCGSISNESFESHKR